MDDATIATTVDKAPRAEWADSIRELAFELWAWHAGRDAKEVARLLTEDHEAPVPLRTIQDWAIRYRWAEIANERQYLVAPAMMDEAAGNVVVNSLLATRLHQRYLTMIARSEKLPDDAKLHATFIRDALYFGGQAPVGQHKPEIKPRQRAALHELPDLTDKSADELEALLRQQMESGR